MFVLIACALFCFTFELLGLASGAKITLAGDGNTNPIFAGEWFSSYAAYGKAVGLSFVPFFHYGTLLLMLCTTIDLSC